MQALQDKNKKTPVQIIENIHTQNRDLLKTLKYVSDRTTPPDIMQSIFELENRTTNFSNKNDISMISQSTIPDASSPSTKLNISTMLPRSTFEPLGLF